MRDSKPGLSGTGSCAISVRFTSVAGASAATAATPTGRHAVIAQQRASLRIRECIVCSLSCPRPVEKTRISRRRTAVVCALRASFPIDLFWTLLVRRSAWRRSVGRAAGGPVALFPGRPIFDELRFQPHLDGLDVPQLLAQLEQPNEMRRARSIGAGGTLFDADLLLESPGAAGELGHPFASEC